jgi:hypothetical protein
MVYVAGTDACCSFHDEIGEKTNAWDKGIPLAYWEGPSKA